MPSESRTSVRFAAVGDLHCRKESSGTLRELFVQAAQAADVILLCGDLTDYGLPEEAKVLADELAAAKVPIVAVLGNHDHESGQQRVPRHQLHEGYGHRAAGGRHERGAQALPGRAGQVG